jgi:hypothetical protein
MISLSTTAFYNGSYKWPQRDAVGKERLKGKDFDRKIGEK